MYRAYNVSHTLSLVVTKSTLKKPQERYVYSSFMSALIRAGEKITIYARKQSRFAPEVVVDK